MRNVKVKSDGSPRDTHIYVDDIELHGVQVIDFHIDADGLATVSFKLIGTELDLDGNFKEVERIFEAIKEEVAVAPI